MNVGDYFKMQAGKIPQIMYDSGNMKTTSYVIKTNSQTGRELDFISEPTKDNAMGKLSSTFSLFTEVAQPQTVPFPFVTNNSNYTLQKNYMFTNVLENIASNETPLYIYICNYLSNAAMIKSDNSCIIYPSQSIGIKNDGTFVYPLQCNINIPTVTTTTLYGNTYITSINYIDTTFTLTYKLYDPTNKYTKKNVDITITTLTELTKDLSGMLTGVYTRKYTFNVSCDPKFTFEIYLSNSTTPPLSLQLNLITAPSPVPSNAPIIIDNNFFNPIYQCPYVLTYQNISSSVYTYQQSTYTFVVQNSINYSFKLYGFDFSFNPPRLQQVTNFSTINNGNGNPYYINYTQNVNQLVYNFGYSGPSENFTQLYMLQIIDNDTDLQLNTLFPIVLNITNSSIPELRDSLNTLNVDLAISVGVGVDILLISTYVALKYYILTLMTTALTAGDAASLVILNSLLAFFSF
jgi:hypothetical protein